MAYYFNTEALRDGLAAERRTQQEAADAAGIGLSAFKMYMSARRKVALQVVIDVAALLNTAPSKLLGPCDPQAATMDLAYQIGITPEQYTERFKELAAA